ncbi:MAG TPA: EAL domain-containing protein [Gammaproteobacteria bacterium]|nr:EAL domain-containing protein [Gammaproteobacteria bacterium]
MALSNTQNMLIKIGVILSIIIFMFILINSSDKFNDRTLQYNLIELKNINNKLDKDILLVRSGLLRHYNNIDRSFLDIVKSYHKLEESFLKSSKSSDDYKEIEIIKYRLKTLRDFINIKEELANTLKSDIGVLRNSLMYFSVINEELTLQHKKQYGNRTKELNKNEYNHIKEKINTDLAFLNSYIIQILRNPPLLKDRIFLKKIIDLGNKIKTYNTTYSSKKIDLLSKHLTVIINNSIEVDNVFKHISEYDVSEILDDIGNNYSIIINNQNKKITLYQNIIYLSVMFLIAYSASLIWSISIKTREIHDISSHLSNQKQALDEHAIVSITDRDGIIKEINENFCRIFNVKSDDVIGKIFNFFDKDTGQKNLYKEINETVFSGKVWRGEVYENLKNGKTIWIDQSIIPFMDSAGSIYQFVTIGTDISSRKKAENDIEYQAYHDVLTDLPNRRLLIDRLEQSINLCRHHRHYGALMFLDLDRFKNINDSLGHYVGDNLLKEISKTLLSCVSSDETIARFGGDEFIILMPEVNDKIQPATLILQNKADEIQKKLNKTHHIKGHDLHISCSIGIIIFPDGYNQTADILQHADIALHKAKEAGRNCSRFFDITMQDDAARRLSIENDLRLALLNNEFKLFFQTQHRHDGSLVGAETLLRWQHAKKGLISPAEFIPVAEDTGAIIQIGEWIFETAFNKINKWCEYFSEEEKFRRISINVSPLQFKQADFVDLVFRLLEKTSVDPSRIEFEITESMLIDNIENTILKINRLKDRGISFSIDDFGTGYSSLSYLNRLPLEKVKVDQSFVRDIHLNKNNETIVQTIIYMANKLNMKVIAEGVETKEELDCLYNLGCLYYQGYYFNMPMTLERFEKSLKGDL